MTAPHDNSELDTQIEEILYDYWARHRDCKNGCLVEGENIITSHAIKALLTAEREKLLDELEATATSVYASREKYIPLSIIDSQRRKME